MRDFILFVFAAALAPAQIVSFGLKAGVPAAQTSFNNNPTALLSTGHWTIGPTFELRLLYGFSVETEALYRGYRTLDTLASPEFVNEGITYPPFFYSYRTNTNAWDFPLLLKYRIGARRFRPFVGAGYTWSHYSSDVNSTRICLGTVDACNASSLKSIFPPFGHASYSGFYGGPTAGVGVEFKRGWLKIAPEVRYKHFNNPTSNQTTIIVGFTY